MPFETQPMPRQRELEVFTQAGYNKIISARKYACKQITRPDNPDRESWNETYKLLLEIFNIFADTRLHDIQKIFDRGAAPPESITRESPLDFLEEYKTR